MSYLTAPLALLRRLRDRRDGTVAMVFGLMFIPVLIAAAGMAVDITRVYDARVRLSAALDDAALAVAATASTPASQAMTPTALQAELNNQLTQYLMANYPSSAIGRNVSATMSDPTQPVINLAATATIDMTFMKILNFPSVTINVANQVTKGIMGLELALVLDNTGSMMCGDADISTDITQCSQGVPPSHMDTLRTDAQQIIDTLFQKSADPTKLKIALVPYVTSVNIGPALGASLNTYVPMNGSGGYNDYKGNVIKDANGNNITYDSTQSQTSTEWLGCVVEPTTSGEDTSGNGPDITEPTGGWTASTMGSAWTPYWWKSGNSSSFTGSNNTWIYTSGPSGNKTTHVGAQFVEVDNGDYATDSNGAYYKSYGPNLGCPKPLVRLTNDQATLDAAAASMASRANSGTLIHIGMIWGWRALSPNPPFADGQPYNTPSWVKAVVLETDGQNDVGSTAMTGLGYLADGKFGSTSLSTASTNMNNRLTTVCNNMKAAGIVIYTIGLGQGATGTASTALKNCAGPAGKGQFYAAPTGADLQSAFAAIANSLNNLRLSK